MRFTDCVARPSGTFTLRVIEVRTGRTLLSERQQNLVVDGSRSTLAQLLGGGAAGRVINGIAVGTGAVAPAHGDSQLTNEFRRNIIGADYPQPEQARFRWQIDDTEANGLAIREFGLYTQDGTLFARKVRGAAIAKTLLIRLEGLWTIQF